MGSTCVLPNHVGLLLPMAAARSKLRGRGSFTLFSSLPTPSFSSSTSIRLPISSSSFGSKPIILFHTRRPSQSSTAANATSEETEAAAAAAVVLEGEENPENEILREEEEEETKPPRNPIIKLGDIMGILNKRAVEAAEKERPVPDIRSGDVVQIKLEVPENRRRASIYKGIVISKQNAGIHTTIRIRRIIAGIGVEIVFPVYSPNIKELKVVSHRKVRRARLYYLRDKLPRLSTFK